MTLDKQVENLERMMKGAPGLYETGLKIVRGMNSPVSLSPARARRAEHEELIAASLAAGIISSSGVACSAEQAVDKFREVLAVLRRRDEGGK